MKSQITNQSMPTTECVQPGCVLKQQPLREDEIAQLILLTISGQPADSILGGSGLIEARAQCLDCIQRVMQGCRPFLTHAEWACFVEAGDWHRRRAARRYRLHAAA